MPTDKVISLGTSKTNTATSDPVPGSRPRLPDFIRLNTDQIVEEWETFARTLAPSSSDMTPLALRDHIHQILNFIVSDVTSAQTAKEQSKKSRGKQPKTARNTAAETHAAIRLAGGFNIGQMVSEYRALRASIIKLWSGTGPTMDADNVADLTRFNESIDQELSESVNYYSTKVVESKDMFVGILGHDLRSPLQGLTLSAELMLHMGSLNDRQTMLVTKMLESAERMNGLISNLLDMTKARFGAGLQVNRAPMDMGFVAHQIIDEVGVQQPARTISLDVSGDAKGDWDKARIGQVFSNLLGNAVQYSFKDSPIDVTVRGEPDLVIVKVHNIGLPISPADLKKIFNPLTRAMSDKGHQGSMNLGLGLFITEEVVIAHGGTINVTSSETDGTTFTARFPRTASAPSPVRELRTA